MITNDPQERVACQSYRFVMVRYCHAAAVADTLLPMADWFGGADKAKGYPDGDDRTGCNWYVYVFILLRHRP